MGKETGISWADHTHNMVIGCDKVSEGCQFCYAMTLAKQFSNYGHDKLWGAGSERHINTDATWKKPLKWNREAEAERRRHRVFCSSMGDNFEDHQTVIGMLPRLWELIRQTPWLDWQLLTKRADRIAESLPADWGTGYLNVWIGVSIENMDWAWRADELRQIPATIRFVSYEPALGALDELDLTGIDWVIYGGESGAKERRPHNVAWASVMHDRCQNAGIAFFYKQDGGHKPGITAEAVEAGILKHEFPQPRLPLPAAAAPVEPLPKVSAGRLAPSARETRLANERKKQMP